MNVLMIVLRVVHVLSGIFWVGFAIFNYFFLQPTIRATGAEGQVTFQYLMRRTKLMTTVYIAATLTMLTGVLQYGAISHFRMSFLNSGWGLIITLGSIAGIIAWFIAIHFIRNTFNRIGAVGQQIQAQGDSPDTALVTQMQGLVGKLAVVAKTALVFMVISVIGMAAARYSNF